MHMIAGPAMNPKTRELRNMHCEQLRFRALHDVTRLREVMQRIAEQADQGHTQGSAMALRSLLDEIGILARAALAGATPPDHEWTSDHDHSHGQEGAGRPPS
jgi:hypothetical protein